MAHFGMCLIMPPKRKAFVFSAMYYAFCSKQWEFQCIPISIFIAALMQNLPATMREAG